ncbi:MAG TPA: SRPBCC family protein [Chitinophagaceae bacterium]|nr:SRPBCC family protein [Chitinophagaceae bacterium]
MSRFFVDPEIARAKTLSTDFYTDPACFEHSKERIFSPSWQFIGDNGVISTPGQCYPFTLLEDYISEPLLLTRDKDDHVYCLSNVCTHRGNILINTPCQVTNLRCRYHGRLFKLDGRFHSMPEFREVENFPSPADDLHKLPLFQWGNWLFTSLGSQLPATEFLQPMMDRVGWMPLHDFVFEPNLSKTFLVQANWALYCENYLEGFHIPFVHAGLNTVIDYGNYTTELYAYSNLQLGIAKEGEECFDLPLQSPDHGKRVAAYYFWVFPNMMFNFYPWGLSVNLVKPVSPSQTKVSFLSYVWKPELRNTGAGAGLDKVEMEDEEIVENVQKGVRSRFYGHGRYSVTREQGTHHFHRLLAEFMK